MGAFPLSGQSRMAMFFSKSKLTKQRRLCIIYGTQEEKMIWKTLQKEIRQVREEKGITQLELSRQTGISRAGIARLENSEKNPTLKTVEILCEALGIYLAPATSHWIINTSFIGCENGIWTIWRDADGQRMLEFSYRGNQQTIPAPAIGNNRENLAMYNLAAEMVVDAYIEQKKKEAFLEAL